MLKKVHIFALQMRLTAPHIKHLLQKKLVTLLLVTASVACFATLGDGGKKSVASKSMLSTKANNQYNFKTFSLKSGYQYRGNQPFSLEQNNNYIMLNTVVTYQKGNSTYILPMKKKVLLDKVTFDPAKRF